MPSKWLNSLKEEESKHNTAAALRESQNRRAARPDETSKTLITPTDETDKTPRVNLPTPITHPDKTDKTPNKQDVEAEKLKTRQPSPSETSKTIREEKLRAFKESVRKATAKTDKTTHPVKTPSEAEGLGLTSTWSVEFGYVALHDPTSGEWHDLRTKDASEWAVREARKRKELYRDGNRKAYRLTSREIGRILEAERPSEEEGIVEDYPVEEE